MLLTQKDFLKITDNVNVPFQYDVISYLIGKKESRI